MDVLTNLIVAIISEYICVSNHDIVYLNLTQYDVSELYTEYTLSYILSIYWVIYWVYTELYLSKAGNLFLKELKLMCHVLQCLSPVISLRVTD